MCFIHLLRYYSPFLFYLYLWRQWNLKQLPEEGNTFLTFIAAATSSGNPFSNNSGASFLKENNFARSVTVSFTINAKSCAFTSMYAPFMLWNEVFQKNRNRTFRFLSSKSFNLDSCREDASKSSDYEQIPDVKSSLMLLNATKYVGYLSIQHFNIFL